MPPTVNLTIPFESLLQAVTALNLDEKQALFDLLQRELLRRKIDEAIESDESPVDGPAYIQSQLNRFKAAQAQQAE